MSNSATSNNGAGPGAPAAVLSQQASPAASTSSRRLVGVDVARGLAVLGMFVVHVGAGWSLADGSNALYPLAAGRAAALFALLAGVSIALLSGGSAPKSGTAMGVALWRVVLRGLLLLPLGTALTMLGTPVSVILAYYAVFFVLAAPLLQERWKVVAGAAVALAVVGPLVSFYLHRRIEAGGGLGEAVDMVNSVDPLAVYAGDGVVNFLLTGAYPAITWMPFVLAGLAVGRLPLHLSRVQVWLVVVGVAVAAVAYTVSWVALELVGVRSRLAGSVDPQTGEVFGAAGVDEALSVGFPGVGLPTSDWAWLLVAAPHSGTPLDVLGAGGVGVAVVGLCLLGAPYARWVVYPLAAVGALALTVYVGHILVIFVAERGYLEGTPLGFVVASLDVTVVVGALVVATVWRLVVGRGPLEWPLHVVSLWVARRIP